MLNKTIAVTFVFFALLTNISCADVHDEHRYHHQDRNITDVQELGLSGTIKDNVREVEVTAFQYGFKPDPIVVARGDKVKILATSRDVRHGFYIPEYNINKSIEPNKTTVIEFIAKKEGEFTIHCSIYCGTGHPHMHARLIVK